MRESGEKMSRQQYAEMLFDEIRSLSHNFSLYGPYSHLIKKMITHMQNGNGARLHDMSLNQALKENIIKDNSMENSTGVLLQKALEDNID